MIYLSRAIVLILLLFAGCKSSINSINLEKRAYHLRIEKAFFSENSLQGTFLLPSDSNGDALICWDNGWISKGKVKNEKKQGEWQTINLELEVVRIDLFFNDSLKSSMILQSDGTYVKINGGVSF